MAENTSLSYRNQLMYCVFVRNYSAEGSFEAVVSAESMKVYAQAAPHAVIATLTKGTTVTVNAWSGRAALISHDGVTGIASPEGDGVHEVGTVFVGLADKNGCTVRALHLGGGQSDRSRVRTMSANHAFDMLLRSLRGQRI